MNTFANLLPSVGGNRPPLSDEELRRLAEMLQQRGEGLAAINPQEAQMLKDAGGSGKPLPGTQGLGMNGGPIRTYEKEEGRIDVDHRLAILTDAEVEALNYLKHQDQEQGFQSGNGPLVQALASMNTHELDFYNYKGMSIPSLNDMSEGSDDDPKGGLSGGGNGGNGNGNGGNGGNGQQTGGDTETLIEGLLDTPDSDSDGDVDLTNVGDLDEYYENESIKMQADIHNETSIQFEKDPKVIQAYNNKKQQGGGDGGGTTTTTTTTISKFYDSLGGEHDTQEAADAANLKIVDQQVA